MYGNRFYNQLTRKYVAIFGTLFNDIKIGRGKTDGTIDFYFDVPVNYGPMQKFLARVTQDPDFNAPALTLPRMTFEISNMTYDPTRKLTNSIQNSVQGERNDTLLSQFMPAPYNLDFELNIMTKYNEDGTKILEQILPFFKPEQVLSVELLEGTELYFDVPIILNSVQHTDDYEADFQTRRALLWTLNFTLKGYFFGPTIEKKVIKFSRARVFDKLDAVTNFELVTDDITEVIGGPGGGDAKQYTVYMNDYIDVEGNEQYGISNTESIDLLHDNDANNQSTSPFIINEVLPEITITAGDTLTIVNESDTYRVLITNNPIDAATGTVKFSVDNLVSTEIATGMPALSGSSIVFTPVDSGSYYYMSPDEDGVAGLISVLSVEDLPQIIESSDTGDDTSNTDSNNIVSDTFTSDRGKFINTGDIPASTIDSRPGLTPDNQPTANREESLPLSEIDWDDNWGIIVEIKDESEFIPLGTDDEQY